MKVGQITCYLICSLRFEKYFGGYVSPRYHLGYLRQLATQTIKQYAADSTPFIHNYFYHM